MADMKKINEQNLEEVNGGANGVAGAGNQRVVANLQAGYLAVRTAPDYKYENEIQSTKLYNGDVVEITGGYAQGPGVGGVMTTYVWVYVPKTDVSGWVNSYFLA